MKRRNMFHAITIISVIIGFAFSAMAGETSKVKADWMKERKALYTTAKKKMKVNPDFKDIILKNYNEQKAEVNAKYKKLFANAKKKEAAAKKARLAKKSGKKNRRVAKRSKKSRNPASDNSSVTGADKMEWISASTSGLNSVESRKRYYNRKGYRLPSNVNVFIEEHDF